MSEFTEALTEQLPDNSKPVEASEDVVKLPKGDTPKGIQDRLEEAIPVHEDMAAGLEPETELIADDRDSIKESFDSITKSLAKNTGVNQEQAKFIQQQASQLMSAKDNLDRENASIDWLALEHSDPGLYALAKLKMNESYQALQGSYQQIMAGAQAQQQAQQRQQAQQAKEANVMLERLIPAWTDPAVKAREVQHLMGHMEREYGFSREELNSIEDPRVAKVIRDLALQKQKAKKQAKSAKIRANRRKPKAAPKDEYLGYGSSAQNKLFNRLMKVM